MKVLLGALCASAAIVAAAPQHRNEFIKMRTKSNHYSLALPHTYTNLEDLPDHWNWANVNGTSYVTKNLNQHIPQYCGSCWAHGAMSALADRIKIARKAQGVEINLSIQYILNCGNAGSCYGGDHVAAYEFVKNVGYVPFDTCMGYAACSSDSKEGNCGDSDYTCSAFNTCRTCSTFSEMGGTCVEIDTFPNATVAEYGEVIGAEKMKAEIFQRGPIACGMNASPVHDYDGGVFEGEGDKETNHIVSVTGWGSDDNGQYWIIRNSWGEYWGEMGYMRLRMGKNALGIEGSCGWATPGTWTEQNFPCYEDGHNCDKSKGLMGKYIDPSLNIENAFISMPGPQIA